VKALVISFAMGLFVGVLYAVFRIKSPAPPIIALLGLLGMVFGEQLGDWVHSKKVRVQDAASVYVAGGPCHKKQNVKSIASSGADKEHKMI
jgi:XapX domain-containing protein